MGELQVKGISSEKNRPEFIKHLIDDISALELMLQQGLIEDDIIRIGSEQEFCLVDKHWRPAKNADEILASINDPHFTTELAKYNLEINLDPIELKNDCFKVVKEQLETLLSKAKSHAEKKNTKVLLTGILPTISKKELELDYMTPIPRYWALNDMIKALRGEDFELRFRGVDELSITHDSVLFEACNTSFQMHLQINPDDFVSSYNWAQAISGPVLGACTNSPLLLGRELWSETRIALFQQSIDTRHSTFALKNSQARVTFGSDWARGTAADIFKNEIAQYKVILSKDIESNSLEDLQRGKIPKLQALNLHNGTIYRWNRPCYGVGNGKPHLRIENRYIPSGPSVIDELANFAFWVGLMRGRPEGFDNINESHDFREVKSNFIKAARTGKESVMNWNNELIPLSDLVINELIPIAEKGLKDHDVDNDDINNLLSIIEKRIKGLNGSQWITKGYRKLKETMKQGDALVAITGETYKNQQSEQPVSNWNIPNITSEVYSTVNNVGHIMSTRVFTVNKDDPAELATSVMKWKNIHHVPVENNVGEIIGVLTWTHMVNFQKDISNKTGSTVADLMEKHIITVEPETSIQGAITTMKSNNIGCLPVLQHSHLVGIITVKDLIHFQNDQGLQ